MGHNIVAGFDGGVVGDLLDRLRTLGVSVRKRGRVLSTRGPQGHERDTEVQSLVARLQGHYASFPDEVLALLSERDRQ
jgi:hypothetical protein